MLIRALRPSDIAAAVAIVVQNYGRADEAQALWEFNETFEKDAAFRPQHLVAEDEAEIIGVAGYMRSAMNNSLFEIFWVNVCKNRQRQGVGKQLVAAVIDAIRKADDDDKARRILLSTSSPEYYEDGFGFSRLEKGIDGYYLMSLALD